MTKERCGENFKSGFLILLLLALPLAASSEDLHTKGAADAEVRKTIIAESVQTYPGNCPCPYSRAKNGSLCGKRSAWSRQGGYAPLCYEKEVSDEMVRQWKQRHGQVK